MDHKTFEPRKDLASLVKCYWTLEAPKGQTPQSNTIVPDGCIKMIFHYGDIYKHHLDDQVSADLPRCFVIGQLTKPYVVEATGITGTFFVCFHPNGFLPFATSPIKDMENTAVSLDILFANEGQRLADLVLKAKTTQERIKYAEDFLLKKLTNTDTVNQIVKSTVDTILTANGQYSVDVLSKQNNTSRRQLSRKFSSDIGLSPKQLSKIIRIQATLKMLLTENISKLTDAAYENEYYDQAHFIREFKEFTGLTPKEFYGSDLKMSLIFDTKD